ncbi:MAG: hypothetical protein KDE20_23900 [Caldilineaceae bacterium]|nr:hypothetical protein [Caldilineaceae bacterium]
MGTRDGSVGEMASFVPQPPRAHVGTLYSTADSTTGAVFTLTKWAGRIVRIYTDQDVYYLFHSLSTNQIDTTQTATVAPSPNAGAPVTSGDVDEIPGRINSAENWVDVCVPSTTGNHSSRPSGGDGAVYLHVKAVSTTANVRLHPSS